MKIDWLYIVCILYCVLFYVESLYIYDVVLRVVSEW